ncbi:mobilization protein [Loktanella sp. M215]|uniref:mobilization protein n=1 Tax=Loktanella sp. M215 TaxID=2675431 RepID=UPI001F38FB68|nr:mobilization protein [Loktanella sp. M215]MCF7702480.1 mobilization protein [Loktanella sp. M215]
MAAPALEKLERQYEQAKARLQSARARKATQDRKIDARRKIILGGALIEQASRDPDVTRLLKSLIEGLARAQDRKAFDGWSPPPRKQTETSTMS